MKLLAKEIHSLKGGGLLGVLRLSGRQGETISLSEQGIQEKLIFCLEEPVHKKQCSYFTDPNSVELGGSESETYRTIYFVAGGKEK